MGEIILDWVVCSEGEGGASSGGKENYRPTEG